MMMIYLKDPVNSFDRLMQTLAKFRCYSGYKLNTDTNFPYHTNTETKKAQTKMGSKTFLNYITEMMQK